MTENLATKPDVNGTPAWASNRTVNPSARAGLRLPSPARTVRPVRSSSRPDRTASTVKLPTAITA